MELEGITPLPTSRCRRAPGPITLNGSIGDPAWHDADVTTLALAAAGEEPRFLTECRLLWDDEHLYVSFYCEDNDIWGTFRNRDDNICSEEVVEIFIDPAGEGWGYYEIEVSPHNVIYDLFILNRWEEGFRHSLVPLKEWDCPGLETAVVVDGELDSRKGQDRSWSVEMKIPFTSLVGAPNTPPMDGDVWRFNLYRIDRGKEKSEHQSFSATEVVDFHRPWRFGFLEFVS